MTPIVVRGAAALLAAAYVTTFAAAQAPVARPGDPMPGLTPQEFAEFRMGLDDFVEVETAGEGLGPAFNGTSCAVCHSVPAIGGAGTVAELRAAGIDEEGRARAYDESGETLFQLFSVPGHACQPVLPDDAVLISRRVPIPLFGAGLVEAIPDETLLALEDPLDRDRDGVSGRAAIVRDVGTGELRVGRFGWKAQHATLLAFGADAYRNEMGITNDLFPTELALGVAPERMRLCDLLPDPEDLRDPRTRRRGIDNFASFMRFLAPVAPAAAPSAGAATFAAIGCASCHVPVLETGPSGERLFDRQPVRLFSDLLLHDIGTGDGIPQAGASGDEFRTPALWGLRFRRPLLHDGSAMTIESAIRRHRREADLSRQGFERLSDDDRAALLSFLATL